MQPAKHIRPWIFPLLMSLVLASVQPAFAQFGAGLGGAGDSKVQVSAQFTTETANAPARLFVKATIQPGWHIYSITQKGEGPIPTEIRPPEMPGIKRLGPFQAYPAPDRKVEELFGNLVVETHHDTVIWYAPIQFDPGIAPDQSTNRGLGLGPGLLRQRLPPAPGLHILGCTWPGRKTARRSIDRHAARSPSQLKPESAVSLPACSGTGRSRGLHPRISCRHGAEDRPSVRRTEMAPLHKHGRLQRHRRHQGSRLQSGTSLRQPEEATGRQDPHLRPPWRICRWPDPQPHALRPTGHRPQSPLVRNPGR